MARTLSSQKVFHSLTGIYRLDDSVTTTTTAGTAAKGAITALDFTDAASFLADDKIRVGANGNTAEILEIASISTNAVTMKLPYSRAIASGETITKLTAEDLGATDENGVNIETSQGEVAIIAGTMAGTYLHINQNVEEQFTFALRDFEKENIIASLGMDETDVGYVSTLGAVIPIGDVASQTYQPWYFTGVLEDGTVVDATIYSAKVAAANQTLQLVEGQAAILPFALRSNGNRSFLFT